MESAEYVRDFRCKCGDCRSVCCRGWRISLSEAEYDRMMKLSCSPALRIALNEAFEVAAEPSREKFAYIAPDAHGNCRVLDADGWCSLHRECGETVQPAVCRLYPRSIKPGEITEFCCSGSCEAVVEMLMRLPHPLTFVRESLQVHSSRPEDDPMDEDKRRRRTECIERFCTPGLSLGEKIARVGAFLGVHEEPDPDRMTRDGLRLLSVLGAPSRSLQEYARLASEKLGDGDGALHRFAAAEAECRAALPSLDLWLQQCLVNHMYYVQFPYAGDSLSPAAAYDGLYGAGALLRLLCALTRDEISFADTAAAVFRLTEHTNFYHNAHIVLRAPV